MLVSVTCFWSLLDVGLQGWPGFTAYRQSHTRRNAARDVAFKRSEPPRAAMRHSVTRAAGRDYQSLVVHKYLIGKGLRRSTAEGDRERAKLPRFFRKCDHRAVRHGQR